MLLQRLTVVDGVSRECLARNLWLTVEQLRSKNRYGAKRRVDFACLEAPQRQSFSFPGDGD